MRFAIDGLIVEFLVDFHLIPQTYPKEVLNLSIEVAMKKIVKSHA